MIDREQLHIWVPGELKRRLDAEAEARGMNKTVLLGEILAERYGLSYVPSPQSARRTTPHGGGPRKATA